ncbi:MAG: polysaccharide biosynthesis C-terminal domain-containing protein [Bacteroidia bacterium]|nr:polysaccharide biosynthesis C-terminal domain-containing protein [Bacteroidia bacterium]
MIRKIIGTILSKSLTSVCNFIVVIVNAHYLGAEGRGEITIIAIGLTTINLFQAIIGGSALVYLTPRHSFTSLISISYIWALLMSIVIGTALVYFKLYPNIYFRDLIQLSFIQGILSIHQTLLLGKERIKEQNILEILRAVFGVVGLLLYFILIENISINSAIKALYISCLVPLFISYIFIYKYITRFKFKNSGTLIKEFFKFGFFVQLNNISQMFNYRFCFYLLDRYYGKAVLGVFSVAVSIAETAWVICRSIATIQYARIANSTDENYKRNLTVTFSKLSYMATFVVLIVMLLIPDSVFGYIFGSEFSHLKPILASLSPGILFLSFFTIINHYYSGVARYTVNVAGSVIGNVVVLVAGLILIPIYGAVGAGLAGSITYLVMFAFLFKHFTGAQHLKLNSFLPVKNDFQQALRLLKKV